MPLPRARQIKTVKNEQGILSVSAGNSHVDHTLSTGEQKKEKHTLEALCASSSSTV